MDIYQHVYNSIIDNNKWRNFLDNANTFKTKRMYVQICSFGNTSLCPHLLNSTITIKLQKKMIALSVYPLHSSFRVL